jgi:peptide/nickel transport system permease protein
VTFTYTFDYSYDEFPQEMAFYFDAEFVDKQPFASVQWITPDGREIRIVDLGIRRDETYRFSQDERLSRRLGREYASYANTDNLVFANMGLFVDPDAATEDPTPLKGTYQIVLRVEAFEQATEIDAEFVLHGKIYGLAGTDHRRRDLLVSLIWGAPIALAFGLVGAVGVSISTITLAAIGVWFGGWIDGLIQRVTEVNMVLPFLSILIMVGAFYSRSLWSILGVSIALFIFGPQIKTYRAMFLQVKESPYIEAARAYGAGDLRIVFFYLIPRLIPMLIPGLVLAVPTFVFLEATLAVLGLGDPILPTWGKIINDAMNNSAVYNGYYYWMLEPALLLTVTGLGFALVGFSLDRVFNPRLRGM